MKSRKVHMDGTEVSGPMHRSLCGYFNVPVTGDATEATCKVCLAKLRRGARARDHFTPIHPADDVAHQLHIALERELPSLAPTAGPPPRLTAPVWDSSCKGGEHRRCGSCVLCDWEREADRFDFASPWTRRHQLARPEGAPRWGSLNAALIAMLEHEVHGRDRGSALGNQLEKIERGDAGGERNARKMVGRETLAAMDVVHVQVALERAYAGGWGGGLLSASECARVLLERTPGVQPTALSGAAEVITTPTAQGVTSYETLSARYGCGEGTLKAIVRHGRAVITEDLATRGLIPARSLRGARAEEASAWHAAEASP